MKKILFSILLSSFVITVNAQEKSNQQEVQKTKFDQFYSKTGTISKFIDNKLTPIKSTYENAETRVRKLIVGNSEGYFYQITKKGKYSDTTASIEYSDLLELIKALKQLQSQAESDKSTNPDYLENRFTTVDGFQIGYYVSSDKINWFLTLEKYGSDKTIFIKEPSILENAFNEAKTKIEEIKK